MSDPLLVLYAIRNSDGKFFASKKHGGDWVSELGKARLYSKAGPARSMITFFSDVRPTEGIPALVELRVTEAEVFKETERVQKSLDRKAKKKAESDARNVLCQRERAEKQIKEGREALKRLGFKP